MSKKVMQMALPLLIAYQDYTGDSRIANKCGEVIEALEAELAKPEQSKYSDIVSDGGFDPRNKYDAQPEQDQLAHDQVTHGMSITLGGKRIDPSSIYKEPEPVAYLYHDASCAYLANSLAHSTMLVLARDRKPSYRNETPLYTSPPRKGLIGLTDNEMHKIVANRTPDDATLEELNDFVLTIRDVEAKLKEKNHAV